MSRKQLTFDDKRFITAKEAYEYFEATSGIHITYRTFLDYISIGMRKTSEYEEYRKRVDIKDVESSKKITINGVDYCSFADAINKLGLDIDTVKKYAIEHGHGIKAAIIRLSNARKKKLHIKVLNMQH